MYRRIQTYSKFQKHLFSIALSIICMMAPSGISFICSDIFQNFPTICAMIFFFFMVLASCNPVCWIYGILCAIFTAMWLNLKCTCPHWKPLPIGCLAETLCTCIITASISLLSFHLTIRTINQEDSNKQQLEEALNEKMCANLLRAIPHDLRTHLGGIIGNCSTYLDHQDSLTNSEKTDIVRSIYEASVWLARMAENLLTITHISESRLSISTRDEPVEEIISEALQKVRKHHPGCVIRVSVPKDFLFIPMDALLIEQVIINLLENALVHSESIAPAELIASEHPGFVSFTVRDYGRGIPKDMLEHLFEGTDRQPCATRGAGLGLVICRTIITAHHGTITGRNHAGGAEFTFTLPKEMEEKECCQKSISC